MKVCLRVICILYASLFFSHTCFASIEVAPIRFFLENDFSVTTLELKNTTKATKHFQADVYKWLKNGDHEELIDTDDIIIVPHIFDIEPGVKRTLRIANENKELDLTNENAYRILIREIPIKKRNQKAILFSINMLIPLFLTPKSDDDFDENVKLTAENGDLKLFNGLNRHIKVIGIKAQSGDKNFSENLNKYLFPKENLIIKNNTSLKQKAVLVVDDREEFKEVRLQ